MKKKVVAALMTSVMCLSMLVGCGNNDAQNQVDNDKWEQTWPDGQKITWMIRDDNCTEDYTRYFDLIAIQRIEDKFHVDIEFVPFNGKAEDQDVQYQALLTSANIPDVIGYMHNDVYKAKGGIQGLYEQGICIKLNDLIETKIPNLAKILKDHPDIAKEMSNNAGEYLYVQRINPLETNRDYISSTTTGLIMRKDWLDAVGMSVPTNMKEWYDVLTAFKNMDPNGNNKKDEEPFNAYSSGFQLFEAAYGMSSGIYIDPDTGKVEHGARTQKYKEYLTEMNKWHMEGLMVGDYIEGETAKTVGTKDGDSNVTGGIAGSWKGLSNNNTKFGDVMRETNPNVELVAVPWPKTADGKQYSQRPVSRLQKNTEIITTNCAKDQAKLDAVCAVINYMYSEEGSLLLTWGEEGVTFTVDAQGNKTLTEQGNAAVSEETGAELGFPNYRGSSKPQYYKMYGNQSDCLPSFGNFDVDSATRDDWYNGSASVWATGDFSLHYPSAITLNAEQSAKVNEGNSQMGSYMSEMKWKFITGQEPLSNFDTYVAELERMGISDVVAVYQEAYDAYMKK